VVLDLLASEARDDPSVALARRRSCIDPSFPQATRGATADPQLSAACRKLDRDQSRTARVQIGQPLGRLLDQRRALDGQIDHDRLFGALEQPTTRPLGVFAEPNDDLDAPPRPRGRTGERAIDRRANAHGVQP